MKESDRGKSSYLQLLDGLFFQWHLNSGGCQLAQDGRAEKCREPVFDYMVMNQIKQPGTDLPWV